jgi:hypothetical protein
MKIGDLVRLRWGGEKHGAGIILQIYWNNANGNYTETKVKWLFSEWEDSSWVLTRDLEILSEYR